MHQRQPIWSEANPEGRWRCFDYEELLKRDKLSLDLFWIKDKSLTDTDSLPPPDVLATEIADDLEAALEQFTKIAARLAKTASQTGAYPADRNCHAALHRCAGDGRPPTGRRDTFFARACF